MQTTVSLYNVDECGRIFYILVYKNVHNVINVILTLDMSTYLSSLEIY